ncbi:Hint domain-containing protein [Acidisphaera sp. S103]|uniref:Hint domain-containing protein n=1 Tax=Acidisphaera sp. S103 TaxID=1747223 RepID=UPI00131C91FD|nr:Hint domain-containing protein [Acidisphaera sp. S103]
MANNITVSSGFTLVSSGGFELLSSGGVQVSSFTPTVSDVISVQNGGVADNVTVGAGGVESVAGGGAANGTTVSAGGVFSAVSGSIVSGLTVLNGGEVVEFNAGTDITNPVTVMSGGLIEFGFVGSAAADTVTLNGDILTATNGARSESITLAGPYTFQQVTGTKVTVEITCFGGGTEILTERGRAPVESIKADDQVVVRRDGQDVLEPVIWVGKTKIDLSQHAHPELAAPIRIKSGALADNTPTRDLVVSPEHCLILSGRCVPAKLLVNGGSIAREYRTTPFEYYHIELANHGILIAEGAEAESYLDTGNRAMFDNAETPRMLHPAFEVNPTSERWMTDACAPLASIKEEVAPIWQMLADRSASLGYAVPTPVTVEGPDLHILADGQRIDPVSDRDSRYVFTIPADVKTVSLASRFCIPADKMVSSVRDTRRLGVSVNWIAIRSGDAETILSADHPALQGGWNDAEQSGATMWRWTDGSATIPWDNVNGAAVLTIRCTPIDQYPVYDEKLALVA